MDMLQEGIEEKIKKVKLNLNELKQYDGINKLDLENMMKLLEMIISLQKDIDELKKRLLNF